MPSEDDAVERCPVEGCDEPYDHERAVACGRDGTAHARHYIHVYDACDSCFYCEDRCRDVGECADCNSCGGRIGPDGCGECGNCGDCCECVTCSRCLDVCGCSCGADEPNVFVNGPSKVRFWPSSKKGFVTNPVKRFVACEIEVAKCSTNAYDALKRVAKTWGASIVSDGSLPSTWFEINTAPANGNQFELQLMDWTDALKEGDAKVNDSCGLHVHVDARDIEKDDLMKVLSLYVKMENSLFGLVAPSRKTNPTCAPNGDTLGTAAVRYAVSEAWHRPPGAGLNWRQKLLVDLYDLPAHPEGLRSKVPSLKRQRRPGARYAALNLHSYFYRRTLEFRLHHGTTQYSKIRNWSVVCASFVDRAVASNWNQIDSWPVGITGLLKLAPDLASKQWVKERWALFNPATPIDDAGRELEYVDV